LSRRSPFRTLVFLFPILVAGASSAPLSAGEWPNWRGPDQNGVAPDRGLVSSWSKTGENLLWRDDFVGRSTPVVFDGRVCTNGRVGEDLLRVEIVACWDAETGKRLWEHRFPVYNTTVPWNRVGWANVTGDPETGYLYAQGVSGLFFVFDRAGKVVWSRNLEEEFGFYSGYGGRTQTPVVDEDRLIVTFASTGWGDQGAPRHRLFAFDKKTGMLLWHSTPGEAPQDLNSQSTPIIAVIDGIRQVIQGNGDGRIYGLKARTGEKLWSFHLSKLAVNTTVLVQGSMVYACHSEENPEGGSLGAVLAFDVAGAKGDVTATKGQWRQTIEAGFSSPTLTGGRLYVLDNSANLIALDAATGQQYWTLGLGTVGKASPMAADGKIYVTEVNGRFHIVEIGKDAGRVLDTENLAMPDGRYAEIYGSVAIAYGRLYFTTEEGIYSVGNAKAKFPRSEVGSAKASRGPREAMPAADAAVATLQVVPADVDQRPGGTTEFRLRAYDAQGRLLGEKSGAEWTFEGLAGELSPAGRFTAEAGKRFQAGKVTAKLGGLVATARVRVQSDPPFTEDFESYPAKGRPPYLIRSGARFEVVELPEGGGKVLSKPPSPVELHKHTTYVGHSDWRDYTIQVDVLGTRTGRRLPDLGVINAGYTFDLMGAHQQLQIRSWASELRGAHQIPFAWQEDQWYTLKLRVEVTGGKAQVRGKVWKRGETEPADWTISVEDPVPVERGSAGLYGYTPTTGYFDNLKVTSNKP
jgi:outer membrane protein assembly factor BamB